MENVRKEKQALKPSKTLKKQTIINRFKKAAMGCWYYLEAFKMSYREDKGE